MKKKITSVIFFNGLAYLIPLLGNPNFIITPQFFYLNLVAVLLLFTQPVLSFKETTKEETADKYSVVAIMAGCVISQMISVFEWVYLRDSHPALQFDLFILIGLFLSISGLIIRISAIKTLGKYFTGTVQIQNDQIIVQTGIYKVIRHPSYLGNCLVMLGNSVLLHAYLSFGLGLIILFVIYYYRIKVEEEALTKNFGSAYLKYKNHTKKLLPFIY